ncbi:DUF192 domain-containing protein [Legionella sp. W05-934-2]|uniref:DUF192 domain-containing protein n=1 Tax=Legionella sp. W05-934-2 TaxID=1198649 RepID=UPI0034629AE5
MTSFVPYGLETPIIFALLMACLLGKLVFLQTAYASPNLDTMPIIQLNINQHPVSVWVPIYPSQYYQGLKQVSKEQLQGKGMLFRYTEHHIPTFTMQGTLTDIDLLCLDRQGTILEIIPMKKEGNKLYKPTLPCRFVLELPAGSQPIYQIKLGDKISFPGNP